MVALSYPDVFAVNPSTGESDFIPDEREGARGEGRAGYPRMSDPYYGWERYYGMGLYPFGYSPYGYSPYGYYGYGYPMNYGYAGFGYAGFGYGGGYFNQKPDGLGIYEDTHGGPFYFTNNPSRPKAGYANWLKNPVPVVIPSDSAGQFLFSTDTSVFKFRGRSKVLPLNLMATFHVKKIRLGVGMGVDYMTRTTFVPVHYGDSISSFQSAKGLMSVMKYYVYGGYDFLQMEKLSFTGDLQVGKFLLKKNHNKIIR